MLFAVLLRQLFNYITVSFLCQAFFKSFLNFLFQALLPLLLLRLVLIRFLLPLRFTSFCLTFSSYCLCTLSRRVLYYYITFISHCQHFLAYILLIFISTFLAIIHIGIFLNLFTKHKTPEFPAFRVFLSFISFIQNTKIGYSSYSTGISSGSHSRTSIKFDFSVNL